MNVYHSAAIIALLGLGLGGIDQTHAQAQAEDGASSRAPIPRLTFEEYEQTLLHWRKEHPGLVTLERRGLSGQTLPVYLLKITDGSVPDADKQACLITALHCGPERTGTTGALAFAEWLLGDDPLAAETRRRQIMLFMPVVNPLAYFHTDRFGNERGVDPYTGTGPGGKRWDLKTLSLIRPQDAPELAAFVSVVDQYRPEVHADLHGTGLQEYPPEQLGARQMYQGQVMTEVGAVGYSNTALAPWDWRVTEAMIESGRAEGFPSDRAHADAQRLFWGPELAPLASKLWPGRPLFYSGHYAYAKCHTLLLTHEVAWEASIVARLKGLVRIGNGPWLDERVPGYPVNRVRHLLGRFVTAYEGGNAAARRESRVELWSRPESFAMGFLYPQTDGRETLLCATSAAAKKALAGAGTADLPDRLLPFVGEAAAGAIGRFLQAGPEIKLAIDTAAQFLEAATPEDDVSLAHGIGFRLRLPYREAPGLEVRLNGTVLAADPRDGFQSWPADGYTQVQVNVPPEKARGTGVFFITCAYRPAEIRKTGWLPPAAVRERCATDRALATPATHVDLPYGKHFRQTLDVWLAESAKPAPVVFYLHGGGWMAQDKTDIHQHLDVRALLDRGISVVSANYRFLADARAAGEEVSPPLRWPLEDARRALQFVRSKARGGEWNLDPGRIAGAGVSAGGYAVLWLALHDDMAETGSEDPVARESTRLAFVAAKAPPTTLDPRLMAEWIPNSEFGGHPFGFLPDRSRPESFAPFLAARDSLLEAIQRYSPASHASPGDPPIFLLYPGQDKPPVKGEPQTDPTHSALFGLLLEERLQAAGVPIELRYRNDGKQPGIPSLQEALEKNLTSH